MEGNNNLEYMKKNIIFVIIVLCIVVLIYGIEGRHLDERETTKDEIFTENNKNMKFKKINERRTDTEVSWIYSVLEYGESTTNEMIKVPGKLKTLFGEPNYKSINNEDWFGYFLEYEDKYFEVYGVSDETHIGGDSSEESLKIAMKLAEYINSAKVTDYEWTSYYMDFVSKVTCGVKNGKPFRKIEQLTLTNEEFSQLYDEVYNLNKDN